MALQGLDAQEPPVSLLTHVTVVDVLSGAEQKDQTVTIRDGRITVISTYSASPENNSAEIIDAHGGFLIPGLWDMHVHVHDAHELPLYVANGITGIRIMAGDRDTHSLRAVLAKETPSPRIDLASAIVDGPHPLWPGSIVIKNEEEARRAVDEIKTSGADFIKVYDNIPNSAYLALAGEAKLQGIPFEGHVPDAVSAQEASAAGQRSMEHLQGVALGCSARQDMLMPEMGHALFHRQKLVVEAQALQSFDAAKCQALFREFRQNQTWQVATLTINHIWSHLDENGVTHNSHLIYVDKASKNRWMERTAVQQQRWGNPEYRLARSVFSGQEKLVGFMARTGVPMMAGSDAMNPYCVPGFSLHEELALLAEAGLTPLAALQTATINPSRFLGLEADEGTVAVGKIANLVLLDSDPLADIHNTTHIKAVWLAGHYYDRKSLDQLLETVKHDAAR